MIDEHLQDLNLLKRLARMHDAFHIAEAVEDGRSFVLIERVDLGAILNEQPADLRIGVHVGGVEGQMVQGVAFVHIQEVRVHAECQ